MPPPKGGAFLLRDWLAGIFGIKASILEPYMIYLSV